MEEESNSRPKIHRLPQHMVEEGGLYVSRAVVILCLAFVLVAVIPALWSLRQVGHKDLTAIVGQAEDALAPAAGKPQPDGIAVRDESGQMIGQIAKMPVTNDVDTHVKSTAATTTPETNKEEDHKELLAIIGKY